VAVPHVDPVAKRARLQIEVEAFDRRLSSGMLRAEMHGRDQARDRNRANAARRSCRGSGASSTTRSIPVMPWILVTLGCT